MVQRELYWLEVSGPVLTSTNTSRRSIAERDLMCFSLPASDRKLPYYVAAAEYF